ncbi:hypothetical protein EVG20_g9688 [Dentipellis fragilis]|uniref:Uncharacterized protein n=1 Tax=Dentipellis fragilis TaxID=205917 RepID=A0A4Y9XW47_9AGAM|nr:hypothetical protein EVG20_g9688 [Dentipellis fragilis]
MPNQLYLYAAGSNGSGQLATGDTDDAHIFTPCVFADHAPGVLPPNTEHILAYAGGGNHTLLLLSFRPDEPNAPARVELWGSGSNSRGQLGPSLDTHRSTFQPIHLPLAPLNLHDHTPIHIAAGWDTSFVVLRSPTRPHTDTVLSCGGNDFGERIRQSSRYAQK